MQITTLGIDLAKSVFQLHGVDAEGNAVLKKKLRRSAVLDFLRDLPPCLIGMEACATAHYWAREIGALGHEVRMMPPAYVKPYVKRQKNDAADAEAICEAVTRSNMRFVPVKSAERQGVLVLHRTRDLLMRQRTMILNAIRGHMAEFGVIAAQGPRKVMDLIQRLRSDQELGLPEIARAALRALAAQLEAMTGEIRAIERRLMAWHRADATSQRLEVDSGGGDHHRHGPVCQRAGSVSLQVRPSVRGLPRAGAATELVRRQGPPRADLEDGGRLLAEAAGGRRHLGDPPGRKQRHRRRGLGAIAAGEKAGACRYGGDGQQDGTHCLGRNGTW